ncbi:MAG: hypothetical protein R3F61_02815 [Myxococcota bacterium]
MTELGLGLMVVGGVMAIGGYAGLLLQALRNGMLWVIALLVLPFFVIVMLFLDFKAVWKPFAINFAGGVILQFGMLFFVLGAQAEIDGVAHEVRPEPGIPAIPGVYVPVEQPPPGLLESIDPMLFALLGGIGVFVLVGVVVGGLLIGTMKDEPEADGSGQ